MDKLENTGLTQLTKTELDAAIGAKMRSNYLYNID